MSLTPHPLDSIPVELTGGVVAVGNFDGMHRGHIALLDAARADAQRRGVPSLALTFEPHPRSLFRPDVPVFRLTSLAAKARLLQALGIDGLVVAAFDRAFAAITAESFITAILVERLKLAQAVVGFDFQFGKDRVGTPTVLAEAGAKYGFPVTIIGPVISDDGAPVASTDIRQALTSGDVARANRLLGYRWFVIGQVLAGAKRGRDLGFATANIALATDCQLRHGIYAVRVRRAAGEAFDGVASYGRRPTFDNGPALLEVYLFGFDGDLYGEELVVTFIDWIRPEEKFASTNALVAAIRRDCEAARALLAKADPGTTLDKALAAT